MKRKEKSANIISFIIVTITTVRQKSCNKNVKRCVNKKSIWDETFSKAIAVTGRVIHNVHLDIL